MKGETITPSEGRPGEPLSGPWWCLQTRKCAVFLGSFVPVTRPAGRSSRRTALPALRLALGGCGPGISGCGAKMVNGPGRRAAGVAEARRHAYQLAGGLLLTKSR